jgi:hypothetical protein
MLLTPCLLPSASHRLPERDRSRRFLSSLPCRGLLYRALALGALLGVLGASPLAHASTPVISPELGEHAEPVQERHGGAAGARR